MALWPFGRKQKRVFVLGIDGVPHTFLERFLAEGRMPNLAKLLGGERLAQMDSCYPTVSNIAWSCFVTGKNPGGFGVYGFAELGSDLELKIPNSKDLRSKTIWEILSAADKRVIGLGVPLTYPPRAVNGVLVGCFLSPKLEGAVHPASMLPKFQSWGYRLDADPMKARESLSYLKQDLLACLAGRARAIEELWNSEPWDLFVTHVMETDRINHFMWKYLREPESENGRFFLDFYKRIDDLIGQVAARLDDRTELVVLSDHGFCETRKEVQVNRWMEERGHLIYSGDPAGGFPALCGRSKAFALVPGRIHILQRGKWERASVEPSEYSAVRDRIIEDLKGWKDPETGEPICAKVFRKEEAFRGPWLDTAPDIIVHPTDGYDLKAALGRGPIYGSSPINGMHTHHDATLWVRGRTLTGAKPVIWDVMPTLLRLLGVQPPADLDGRALVE